MSSVQSVLAREILDSRGNPTVEVRAVDHLHLIGEDFKLLIGLCGFIVLFLVIPVCRSRSRLKTVSSVPLFRLVLLLELMKPWSFVMVATVI